MDEFKKEFLQPFEMILDTLAEYGWVASPHMIGKDFAKVVRLCEGITKNPPTTDEQRLANQADINNLITSLIYHPLTRAFFVHRSQELTYTSSFSHHLDRAIIHYFRNDYFSAVHCLLPAIEGVLLSYYGWQYGTARKPTIKLLIEEVEKCRTQTIKPAEYKLYGKAIGRFLKDWIFSDTNTADMSLSYLNRHYVLHGMGNNSYYTLADCHRLILFFDLLIEFLAIEERKLYAFIPEKNDRINERGDYYFNLIKRNIRNKYMMNTESKFLKQNVAFIEEGNPPDWNFFKKVAISEYLEMIKFIQDLKNKNK